MFHHDLEPLREFTRFM